MSEITRHTNAASPVFHDCVKCGRKTVETVGLRINEQWHCFTCGSLIARRLLVAEGYQRRLDSLTDEERT